MTPTQCICEKPYIAVGTEHCANCGGYPTEDTPTHDPQQDNLPPFHFRCQQGKVHSIEEGCDCKQDDTPVQLLWCDCGQENYGKCDIHLYIDKAIATAQIQLVSELEGELPEKEPVVAPIGLHELEAELNDEYRGHNKAIDKVTALLEHKKQELEGKI